MAKIIFLDIDGVLNASDDFGGRSKPNPKCSGFCGIATTKVKKLARIVNETGAEIVLVSSWKRHYEIYCKDHMDIYGKYLHNKLRKQGLQIIDTTLRYEKLHSVPNEYRGTAIKQWLKDHPEVTNYIVLDDEIFDDYAYTIYSHLVQTTWTTGLTDELVAEAIEKLKE